MINVQGNLWIPGESYKYLTNGVVYTDSIYLGARDSIDNWRDTNDEPSEPDPELTDEEALDIILGGAT